MEHVTDVIIALLSDKFGVFESDLAADATFDSLEVDSLVLVELAVILAREYGVPIGDDELAATRTIGGAAEMVTAKLRPGQVTA